MLIWRARPLPPATQKLHLFLNLLRMPFLAENDAKRAPQGDPKILKNRKKSLKVLPQVLSGRLLYADPEKNTKKSSNLCVSGRAYMQSVHACAVETHFFLFTLFPFHTFLHKCIQKTSQMLPFGYLLGSCGHLNASTCRFLGVSGAA